MLVLCVQARGGFHWEECHGLGCVKLRSLTKLQIMGWSEACWIDPRRSCVPVRLCRLPDQTPPARARAKLWAAWFLERHDGVHERRTRTGRQASRGQKVRYAWAQWRVNAAHRFAPRKFFFLAPILTGYRLARSKSMSRWPWQAGRKFPCTTYAAGLIPCHGVVNLILAW